MRYTAILRRFARPSEAAAACECLTLRQRRCGFHRQFIAGRMVCLLCVNTEWIVAALDAEIARLRLARTLVAQSTTAAAFGYSGVSISNDLKPKKRNLPPAARERIAAAQRQRWAKQKKPAVVTITRLPAKEAPKRRATKPVGKSETPLTANIPDGPVAVPADKRAS
jgi:hypothetical protein